MCKQNETLVLTTTTVAHASGQCQIQKVQQSTRSRPAFPLRSLIFLVCGLALLRRRCNWGRAEEARQAEAQEVAQERALASLKNRDFMQAGSVYQNDYMTLWNAKGAPISVTLRVKNGDSFELRIEHLNSAGGGSDAWLAIQGGFRMEPLRESPERSMIIPQAKDGEEPFLYDASLFDRTTAFAMRCLQKMSGAMLLKAVELEVDTVHDAVMVTPRSSTLRVLWAKPVVLRLSSEADLWEMGSEDQKQVARGHLVV